MIQTRHKFAIAAVVWLVVLVVSVFIYISFSWSSRGKCGQLLFVNAAMQVIFVDDPATFVSQGLSGGANTSPRYFRLLPNYQHTMTQIAAGFNGRAVAGVRNVKTINIPLWPLSLILLTPLLIAHMHRKRGRCRECGYDLRGHTRTTTLAKCPECGNMII